MRKVHLASKVRADGKVSARCYMVPRAIDRRAGWTLDRAAVTCIRCERIIIAELLKAGEAQP
ncbi:MAG: hypothetical protein Q7J73_08200 [Dehalococcoidales bacterium]|nr:hypothetical protein [Dehalococcoidales bacterium]